MESGKSILLVAQKTAAQDDPTPEDLYDTGSVATVLQMLKLPMAPSRYWWKAIRGRV